MSDLRSEGVGYVESQRPWDERIGVVKDAGFQQDCPWDRSCLKLYPDVDIKLFLGMKRGERVLAGRSCGIGRSNEYDAVKYAEIFGLSLDEAGQLDKYEVYSVVLGGNVNVVVEKTGG